MLIWGRVYQLRAIPELGLLGALGSVSPASGKVQPEPDPRRHQPKAVSTELRKPPFCCNPAIQIPETRKQPSPKLTWKLIEGPIWRIVVLQRAPLHFHVILEERNCHLVGEVPHHCLE